MGGAPAGFKTAVQAAVQFFDTLFTNNISVNIAFGWGEVAGDKLDAGSVGESSAYYEFPYTYGEVRSALVAADAGTPLLAQAVQTLPTINPAGAAQFAINTAEEKALGVYTGSASLSDGAVGLDSSSTFTFDPDNRAVPGAFDAIGVLEHEISEVLGRSVLTDGPIDSSNPRSAAGENPLDLFRFTAQGVHSYQEGSAYFSLDNGATNLKAFNNGNNGGDGGDWATSSQPDAFDAFGKAGAMSPVSLVDVEEMELLGYTVSPSATILLGTSANSFAAAFTGVYRQYTVGAGGATVSGGPEAANDTLADVQRIKFVDGYLDYSATDPAGQVYRLYEATLARAPDPEGLANWVSALAAGSSLQGVANGFVASTEFQTSYGALDNTGFVTLLYGNVLHRAPDAGGLSNWVNLLNSGQDSRAQVVLGFSESQEDIDASAAAIGQGIWVGNAYAAEVARLYDSVFGRLPDLSGLTNWTQQLQNGSSLQTVANGFVGSQEFQTAYGALDNTGFVTLLYNNVLHRAPDASGLANWVNLLTSGQDTRAQVVVGFSESAEHVANTAAHIDSGIWLAS